MEVSVKKRCVDLMHRTVSAYMKVSDLGRDLRELVDDAARLMQEDGFDGFMEDAGDVVGHYYEQLQGALDAMALTEKLLGFLVL